MAGLSDLITNSSAQTTSMPSWYDTAQQNIASQAGAAAANAPAPGATVAQGAVNQLSGPTNAFTTAANTAQNIATGAANPWITDATGGVTPNTGTALGGLFAAQNQQLQQMIPNITADPNAQAIGSGQFGSLRSQTAANKAIADAQANLFAQQNQAALQNQQTGVQAATAAGGLTNEGINQLMNVGQYQQASPFTNASNYGKVIGGLQAPTTVTNRTQLSPLNQVGSLLSFLGGPTGSGGVLNQLGFKDGLSGLVKGVGSIFNPSGLGMNYTLNPNQTPTGPEQAGLIKGEDGKWYKDPTYGTGKTTTPTDPGFEDNYPVTDPNEPNPNDPNIGGTGDDEFYTGGGGNTSIWDVAE